jgi:hypothetical protein
VVGATYQRAVNVRFRAAEMYVTCTKPTFCEDLQRFRAA